MTIDDGLMWLGVHSTFGAATEKAYSPRINFVLGTYSSFDVYDQSCLRMFGSCIREYESNEIKFKNIQEYSRSMYESFTLYNVTDEAKNFLNRLESARVNCHESRKHRSHRSENLNW